MSNGGTAYAQRKAAAEAFAENIKAAANNPGILRINVLEKASKIVVVPQDIEPFIIENNGYTAFDLAQQINAKLKFTPPEVSVVSDPGAIDIATRTQPDLSALTGTTILSTSLKDGNLTIEYQKQENTTDQVSIKVSNV